ncbi:hypothetical protein PQR05_14775 [Paraburkholderia sediminicola]
MLESCSSRIEIGFDGGPLLAACFPEAAASGTFPQSERTNA